MVKQTLRLTLVALIVSGAVALADTIVLENGDTLTGKVVTIQDGKVVFESALLGKQEIDLAKIKNIATDEALPVNLKDGSRFNSRIISSDGTSIVFEKTANLPAQTISREELVSVNPPEKPKARWKGDITGGLTSTHGNSFAESGSLTANASLRREKDRTTLGGTYLISRSENDNGDKVTKEESFSAHGKYDYYFTRKFYGFIDGRYKTDHIADLDRRLIAGLGGGYQWIESDLMNFSTDLGLSMLNEKYTSDDLVTSNEELSARVGYHFDKSFTDKITFNHNTEYYPSVQSGPSDYFLTSDAEIRLTLTKSMFSSFKAIMDYDSTPAPGLATTDMKYIIGVGWSF